MFRQILFIYLGKVGYETVKHFVTRALKEGSIDCAVVAGVNPEEPFSPRPELALTIEETLKSAGAKYFYSPNVLALNEVSNRERAM